MIDNMPIAYLLLPDTNISVQCHYFLLQWQKGTNADREKYQHSPGAYQNGKPCVTDDVLNGVSFLGAGLSQNVARDVVECEQYMMFLVHMSRQSNLHLRAKHVSCVSTVKSK